MTVEIKMEIQTFKFFMHIHVSVPLLLLFFAFPLPPSTECPFFLELRSILRAAVTSMSEHKLRSDSIFYTLFITNSILHNGWLRRSFSTPTQFSGLQLWNHIILLGTTQNEVLNILGSKYWVNELQASKTLKQQIMSYILFIDLSNLALPLWLQKDLR